VERGRPKEKIRKKGKKNKNRRQRGSPVNRGHRKKMFVSLPWPRRVKKPRCMKSETDGRKEGRDRF